MAEDPNGLQAHIKEDELLGVAFAEMESLQPWAAYPGDMGTQAEQMFRGHQRQDSGRKRDPGGGAKVRAGYAGTKCWKSSSLNLGGRVGSLVFPSS